MADHALATVTNPTSALTDFTLIVDLSTMPASWWSAVTSSDGTRGRVYKGDGTTRLPVYWHEFDSVAETGFAYVLWSGTLATTGTQQLWIEPPVTGNAAVAVGDTYGQYAVFAGYEMYIPDGGSTDVTGNGHDGTASGGVSLGGGTGAFGSGTVYDGTDDYASIADSDGLTLNPATGSTWVIDIELPASLSGWGNSGILTKYADNVPMDGEWFLSVNETNEVGGANGCFMLMLLDSSPTDRIRYETNVSVPLGQRNHLAAVWDGTFNAADDAILYINGTAPALTASPDGYGSVINRTSPVTIGAGLVNSAYASYAGATISHVALIHGQWSAAHVDHDEALHDQATFWGTWTWTTTGGGTTFSVSVSDGISLSDSPSGALTIPASVSDGVSLADTTTGPLRISASVADGVSFADSSGGTATIPVNVADSIVLSDTVLTAFTFGVQVSDGVTLSDQATEGGVIQVTASDGITFSDSASAVLRILQTISDGVVFSDETSATGTITAVVSDGVTFSDAVTTALRVVASVSDGVRLSDVAIDSTFLPVGRVQIRVTTAQASVTITAKQPGVSVAFE